MNEKNTKITNLNCLYSVYGYITLPVGKSIYIKIAKLTYEIFEDESYQYIFEPYYDVINALNSKADIPGINLELRKEKYYRVNLVPIFISDRTFPKSRIEARKLLKERNLNYYSPMLWLMDSSYTYTGDSLLLKSEEFYKNLVDIKDSKNIYRHILYALQKLGTRNAFSIDNLVVDDENRTILLQVYMNQYKLVEHTYYSKLKGNTGRSKTKIPIVLMKEVVFLYEKKIISLKEAMERIDVKSESTFFRRLKEYRKNIQE
ncbi:MAG: hypothetical protein QM489_05910 [Candidatus Izemoplasma sp.]